MNSSSFTFNDSFSIIHARQLAAKVATDLKRVQRFYGDPTDQRIKDYEEEISQLLKEGYVDNVIYGYKRNGKWITPTLKYVAKDLTSGSLVDDDPGKVPIGADITGASFYSFLTYSDKWSKLSDTQREDFEKKLPFSRGDAPAPESEGYFSKDLSYGAGGKVLDRSTLKKI